MLEEFWAAGSNRMGDEFHRSSELGIHLLSLRVLKRSHGVQTRV